MRILVIEDEHKIANSIKQGLEQEKFVVDTVYDGKSGLDLASTEEYDLIILDRMLPEMDGIIITKKLRKQKIHTPILMLTAKGQIEDKVEGLDCGADDYLTKPFAFTELLARIRAISRRPKNSTDSVLKVADLTMDTTAYQVKRGEKKINLSSKEFVLLEYLMRHPNRIIKKEQIINNVWSYDADVLPNSVEVYIKHLRDKIDTPFNDQPLIHTIRGFGYKIGEK
ncbi:MAG: response regulator transcription factor [Patescibacteria group bacterium]|nr:response regulator transcription factor [Patescibacteria group bacterium]